MDLWAYSNIENIEEIAKKNNIDCPRLRGYRLMKNEEPINFKEWLAEERNNLEVECAEFLCTSVPFWNPHSGCSTFCRETDLKVAYYIDKETGTVRWDRIHGWKRRVLKTYIHNEIARYKKQYEVWNKYVGRDDVLYIHARIGGGNWSDYWKHVVYQPWFLEKVDDGYDSTYCDIYAKIGVVE